MDKYWEEYLDFIRQLSKELKEAEPENASDIFSMLIAPEKFVEQRKIDMFKEIGEHSFWMWYCFVKSEKGRSK